MEDAQEGSSSTWGGSPSKVKPFSRCQKVSWIREKVKQFSVSQSRRQFDCEYEFETLYNSEKKGNNEYEDGNTSTGSGGFAASSILFGMYIDARQRIEVSRFGQGSVSDLFPGRERIGGG